ncbi:MAG TPA: oligosaccharide flippase family protein [Candidatus Thermoplasmatota archaeon]|nr:oligosaccharide flippase family protein [Candidatus Thermoplasmatota archaeon]
MPPATAPAPAAMKSRVATSTVLMFASFFVAALFDYAFSAGMTWMLAPEDYGALSVAMSFFLLLSYFVGSGFPMSLAKVLAEREGASRGLIRYAVRGNLVLSFLVVALFLALTLGGPLSPGEHYETLLIAVAATILLLSVGTTLHYALQGRMAFTSFALLHASKSVSKLLFGALFVLLGFGVAGALGGLVVGGILLILAAALLLRKHADAFPEDQGLEEAEKRRFLRDTGAIFLGSLALTLLMNLDLLAVKYLSPVGESDRLAAYYQSASILAKAPLWALIAGLSVFFPLMSREAARNPAAASALLRKVLRWTLLALAPVAVLLAAFPGILIEILFPQAYQAAAPALAVSALGMGALCVCFVLTRGLQATHRASTPGAFLAVTAALQVALLVAFIPKWGILGAAAATSLACLAGALLALGASVRAFKLRVDPWAVLKVTTALGLLAAVVAAFAPATRLEALLAVSAGLFAYAAALLLLGVLSPEERRRLARLLPAGRAPRDEAASPTEEA